MSNSATRNDQIQTELQFPASPCFSNENILRHSSETENEKKIVDQPTEQSQSQNTLREKNFEDTDGHRFEKGAKSKCSNIGLLIADNVLTALVIGPMTVLFWQGLWDLLGRNIFPENELLNWLVCSIIGNVGILLAAFGQTTLATNLKPTRLVDWGLGYHVYTYLLGLFNISQWRGLWTMLDVYTGINAKSVWASFFAGYFMLCTFRCLKTAEAPPMAVCMDTEPEFFRHSTRFNKKVPPKISFNYVLDTIFTVMVIQQLVVVYWRGAWGIMDQYIYPDDPHHSALASLLGSYILQAVVCILQPLFNAVYRRVHGNVRRTALEYSLFSVSNLIAIAHWRGIWMLSAANFMPDTPDLGCTISHSFGIVVLMLMLCGHSVAMKGCEVDGSSSPEDGCYCHNKYFRYFYETRLRAKGIVTSQGDERVEPLLLSNGVFPEVIVTNGSCNVDNNTSEIILSSTKIHNDLTGKGEENNNAVIKMASDIDSV